MKNKTRLLRLEKPQIYYLNTPLNETDLCSRALNVIEQLSGKRINELTIFDLSKFSEKELFNQRNLGRKTIRDIKYLLNSVGLSLDKYSSETFSINNNKAILFVLIKLHILERQRNNYTRGFRNWLREHNLLNEK